MSEEDFLDIGQDNEDLSIDFTIGFDGYDTPDVRDQPGFEYPAMLITGVHFNDTLRVLQSIRRESYRLFDVWVDLENGQPPVKQGNLPADISTFLSMRYLGLTVTLYLGEDEIQVLNLHDISVLEKFI